MRQDQGAGNERTGFFFLSQDCCPSHGRSERTYSSSLGRSGESPQKFFTRVQFPQARGAAHRAARGTQGKPRTRERENLLLMQNHQKDIA